jgi:hypothetical protein
MPAVLLNILLSGPPTNSGCSCIRRFTRGEYLTCADFATKDNNIKDVHAEYYSEAKHSIVVK